MTTGEEYYVDSVADAIALAEQFKQTGQYDWFRGQAHEWPLCPTINRLDEKARNTALLRLAQFGSWIQRTPEARYLKSDEAKLAVAQHYGIATHFLDFTTLPRVAAFFAAHKPPKEAKHGFVLCLNKADLERFWSIAFPNQLPLRFVEIHVPDLWRLQAQHGVFLDCPYANIEDAYPLDRIIFPLENVECPALEAEIYPKRKSRLEQLLDRYFETERQWATLLWLNEIGQQKNMVFSFPDVEKAPEQLVPLGRLPEHPSWNATKLRRWLMVPNESFHRIRSNDQVRLSLPTQPKAAGRAVSTRIRELLAQTPSVRSRIIGFTIMVDASTEFAFFSEILPPRLEMLWDGLRTLPCREVEVAESMGVTVQLTMEAGTNREAQRPGSPIWREAANRCFGETIEIEFGAQGGGGNRAYVAIRDLLAAMRPDLEGLLAPEAVDICADIRRLLSAFSSPRRLFQFDTLTRLFMLQAVPFQVCARTPPFLFSPAGLFTLGLP